MMTCSLAIRFLLLAFTILLHVAAAAAAAASDSERPQIVMEGHPGDKPIVVKPQYNRFAPIEGRRAGSFGERDLLMEQVMNELGYGVKKFPDGTFEVVPLAKHRKNHHHQLQHSPQPWVGILPPLPPKSSSHDGNDSGSKTTTTPTTPQAAPQAAPEPVVKPSEASSTSAPGAAGVNGTSHPNGTNPAATSSVPETGVPGFVFPPGSGQDTKNAPTPNANANSGGTSTSKSPDGTSDSGVQGPTASSRPSHGSDGSEGVGSVGTNATRPPSRSGSSGGGDTGSGKKTNEQPGYLIGILIAVVIGLILILIL